MDTSMTHLDAMISEGFRGGKMYRGRDSSRVITEWDERRDDYGYLSPSRKYTITRINNVHECRCEQDTSFVY